MVKAVISEDANGQTVRLPKGFRINATEVFLKRTPEGVVLMDRDPWDLFQLGVEQISEDFMSDDRQQPPLDDVSLDP